jgi:hypothetical protein
MICLIFMTGMESRFPHACRRMPLLLVTPPSRALYWIDKDALAIAVIAEAAMQLKGPRFIELARLLDGCSPLSLDERSSTVSRQQRSPYAATSTSFIFRKLPACTPAFPFTSSSPINSESPSSQSLAIFVDFSLGAWNEHLPKDARARDLQMKRFSFNIAVETR